MSMCNPMTIEEMREELTKAGFKELRTGAEVDQTIPSSKGTALIVINSVCGCAAGGARPGVVNALKNEKKPQHLWTVFAGQDKEATEKARSYFHGIAPSSPSFALLKDGEVVHFIPRQNIEGHSASQIAEELTAAFNKFC